MIGELKHGKVEIYKLIMITKIKFESNIPYKQTFRI